MSLVSSFTLRPYSSVSSSCCDDDAGGGGNGSSAFESYDSTNNPNHERNHPIPLSDTHPTNTLHQFIPIGNGIFAGTMLQDRPKRPASLRFELGGDRQLLPQMPMTTAQSPPREEEESEQPRTPSTLFSLNSKTEPDYKALHLQSEIRVFEHRREISRLQEEKRQLRLKLIDLQAQLLESQTAQQQQQQQRNEEDVDVPLVEDPATPQHETRHARSESKSLPQQVDGDVECPPVQMLTYSNPQQEDDQLCNEQIPVEVHDKENTNPAITATSIVLHKSNPEASSSDDCSGRKRGSRGKKRLHNNDEVAFEKPPESTPPHLVTTRRSSRRRAKTTVPAAGTTTTATTPPSLHQTMA
ncbi:hypothetical protein MHU86_11217 [Fragilaria crotonensis]|nr:hypothetical protein MHU86_11217 [Fragilaria crotonensis]